MPRTGTYRGFPPRLLQSRRHAFCGTIGERVWTITRVSCSGGSLVGRARTRIGKMKPLAMPRITSRVSAKHPIIALKATPSIVTWRPEKCDPRRS